MPVKVFRNVDVLRQHDVHLADYLEQIALAVANSEILVIAPAASIRVPLYYYSQKYPPVQSTLRTNTALEIGKAVWYNITTGKTYRLKKRDSRGVLQWEPDESQPRIFFGQVNLNLPDETPLGIVASLSENWAAYVDDPIIETTNAAFVPAPPPPPAPRYPEAEPLTFQELLAKLEKLPD